MSNSDIVTDPAGQTMPKMLQPGQVEAHVSRLTAVRTQLGGYAHEDGRAAEAMPLIDSVIASLQQDPFATPTGDPAKLPEIDPDDLPFE